MFRRLRPGRALVIGVPFLWLAVFFLLPFAIVGKISVSEAALAQPPYRPLFDPGAGLAGLRTLLAGLGLDSYRALGQDGLYGAAALTSLLVAGVSTAILVGIGLPIALAMARAAEPWRPLLVTLVIVPFWTSFLIRVYAWIGILRPEGWLDWLVRALGIAAAPLGLLDTNSAIVLGAVYAYLPFCILPIYASLERQDPLLLEAAADLGAGPVRSFWTVTVPLAWPGIAAGALLCFIPITGEFIIPDLLGGAETLMLGRTLWSEFFANRDWPLASAVAVMTTLGLLGPILVFRHIEARRLEGRT